MGLTILLASFPGCCALGKDRAWFTLFALALSPSLSPLRRRPGTHCLRMWELFHYMFHKKPCALTLFIMTKNTELF